MSVHICTAGEADAPARLRAALAEHEAVVWLAPDRELSGSLDALTSMLDRAPIVLAPACADASDPERELEIMTGGVFGSGVLAVRRGAEPFLEWWDERLSAEPELAPPQRWLNLVPGYFECAILHDPIPIRRRAQPAVTRAPEPAPTHDPPSPPPAAPLAAPAELAPGVNLVLRAGDDPLAVLAADIEACLVRLGIPCARTELVYAEGGSRLTGADPRAAPFDTDLVCLNPLDLAAFAFHVDAGFFSLRRSVGVWLLEEAPVPDLSNVTGFVDELWTASAAAAAALATRTGKETHAVPVPVHPADRRPSGDTFEVVTVAALGGPFAPGAAERANPIGALRVYAHAFAPDEGATLLVRTSNGARDVPALEELKLATERADVTVVDGPLPADERRRLVARAGCYLSLARSSELDLAALEALAAGTPVVATGTGLDVDGFHRVRSMTTPLPEAFRTALSGDEWQEPDLDDAARLLRLARTQPAPAGDGAARDRHSIERLEAFLAERLASLLPARKSRARRALARILG
jgi:hypothetical protein